jgi:hypothetical protein
VTKGCSFEIHDPLDDVVDLADTSVGVKDCHGGGFP